MYSLDMISAFLLTLLIWIPLLIVIRRLLR